jgi:hypothetical protein
MNGGKLQYLRCICCNGGDSIGVLKLTLCFSLRQGYLRDLLCAAGESSMVFRINLFNGVFISSVQLRYETDIRNEDRTLT